MQFPDMRHLRIGYFGASTGAAAALVARCRTHRRSRRRCGHRDHSRSSYTPPDLLKRRRSRSVALKHWAGQLNNFWLLKIEAQSLQRQQNQSHCEADGYGPGCSCRVGHVVVRAAVDHHRERRTLNEARQPRLTFCATYLAGTQTNETSGAALPVGLTVSVDLAAFRHESLSGKSPTLSAPVPLLATHIKISAVGIIHPLCANKIILSMKIILDCQTALIFSNIPPTQAARQAGRPEFGRKYKVGHRQIQIGPPRVETSEPLRHPIAELVLARQVLGYGLKFGALDILVNCAGDGQQGRQRARLFRARLGFLLRPQRQVDAPHHQGLPARHAAKKRRVINIFSVI